MSLRTRLRALALRVEARMVDDWRQAWRWGSMRWMALSALLQTLADAWGSVPATVTAHVPKSIVQAMAVLTILLALQARVTKTKGADADADR